MPQMAQEQALSPEAPGAALNVALQLLNVQLLGGEPAVREEPRARSPHRPEAVRVRCVRKIFQAEEHSGQPYGAAHWRPALQLPVLFAHVRVERELLLAQEADASPGTGGDEVERGRGREVRDRWRSQRGTQINLRFFSGG